MHFQFTVKCYNSHLSDIHLLLFNAAKSLNKTWFYMLVCAMLHLEKIKANAWYNKNDSIIRITCDKRKHSCHCSLWNRSKISPFLFLGYLCGHSSYNIFNNIHWIHLCFFSRYFSWLSKSIFVTIPLSQVSDVIKFYMHYCCFMKQCMSHFYIIIS